MNNFFKLIGREFRLFFGNSVMMAIFIGAPLAYGILFGYVYKKGKVTDVPIVVVDLDRSPMSDKMIDMLDDNEVINVVEVQYDDVGLKDKMLALNADAVVVIPKDFEADILQKRHPEVNVNLNLANILTANYASRAVQISLGTFNAGIEIEALKKSGVPDFQAVKAYEPFKVNFIKYYNPSSNYMYFLWPGMLATILQQVLLLAFALSFAKEFEQKTFYSEFFPKAGNTFMAIMIKGIPFWIMSLGLWLLYGAMYSYFRLPFPDYIWSMTLLAGLLVMATSFLGIMVSIAIPSQLKATEILMVIATPSFVISGFTWPLSQMPVLVQEIAKIIPLTHFLEGFRKIYFYEVGISKVMPQVFALLLLCIIFFLVSWVMLKIKVRNGRRKGLFL